MYTRPRLDWFSTDAFFAFDFPTLLFPLIFSLSATLLRFLSLPAASKPKDPDAFRVGHDFLPILPFLPIDGTLVPFISQILQRKYSLDDPGEFLIGDTRVRNLFLVKNVLLDTSVA